MSSALIWSAVATRPRSAPRLLARLGVVRRSLRYSREACHQQNAARPQHKKYDHTLRLPRTAFPMRLNAAQVEPRIQQECLTGLYPQLRDRPADSSSEDGPAAFILHDGPPFANGDLHMGHVLNKVLKDVICRYQALQGRPVHFRPGWDCHGLPIEVKAVSAVRSTDASEGADDDANATAQLLDVRQTAATFAAGAIDRQRTLFKRLGILADWERPYITMTPEYEAAQLKLFHHMLDQGLVYRRFCPVQWSPQSQTALAEAEVEYYDHTSTSAYVRFPLINRPTGTDPDTPIAALIWTTTPWTLLANQALAFNPGLRYVLVRPTPEAHELLLIAYDRLEALRQTLQQPLDVIQDVPATALGDLQAQHPLHSRTIPFIAGDHVTSDAGTGVVHTAPAHGVEDFRACQRVGIDVEFNLVDGRGRYRDAAGPQLAGLEVLGEGNTTVLGQLEAAGSLVHREAYQHRYPYDWRTKTPLLFRATRQWFADLRHIGEHARDALADVHETDQPLVAPEALAHIRECIAEHGSDFWWRASVAELLPLDLQAQATRYKKSTDTLDVWFDSGSSWSAVLEADHGENARADVYLEGSDQHRGWFQSSLLLRSATRPDGQAPYRQLLTHGFVLDEQGQKMSKSLGNGVDPSVVINGGKNLKQEPAYGADTLRLWAASVDYTNDVSIGPNTLRITHENLRKIRNALRFMHGNLGAAEPALASGSAIVELPSLEAYLMHLLADYEGSVKAAYDQHNFLRVHQITLNFIQTNLSGFYFEIIKDRLYAGGQDSSYLATLTVLRHMLTAFEQALAPILVHTIEESYEISKTYGAASEAHSSVMLRPWTSFAEWHQPALGERFDAVRELRREVFRLVQATRETGAIKGGSDARVSVRLPSATGRLVYEALDHDALTEVLLVSQTSFARAALPSYQNHSSPEVDKKELKFLDQSEKKKVNSRMKPFEKRAEQPSTLNMDDDHIRHVEREVIIRKMVKESAGQFCQDEMKAFADCARGRSISVVWACREVNDIMKRCIASHMTDADFERETQRFIELRRLNRARLAQSEEHQ
ncbi:uncharacterized protein MONBRDRAFT_32431 [Monosiga brevicollis MX1]|uniref:isoleucine--tRNA ligase n=1 Tax=Monosiga brevicollis TaxID=81824 RepID=A9UZH0_MONBE|nr:uncharacterized protein MONBRDRAFT_32431 [Monosiga brevicollis MX1]EDQ89230.1 predicted protein [Monosiga brevicollis MX1]|eukprot:XP_001745806.1 hypothetical protein [Monosiga brevicollis MX1]